MRAPSTGHVASDSTLPLFRGSWECLCGRLTLDRNGGSTQAHKLYFYLKKGNQPSIRENHIRKSKHLFALSSFHRYHLIIISELTLNGAVRLMTIVNSTRSISEASGLTLINLTTFLGASTKIFQPYASHPRLHFFYCMAKMILECAEDTQRA